MSQSLLDVQNLIAGYLTTEGERVMAVRDVSFSIEPGEVVGIAGESGCGKTTLAQAAVGLLQPPGEILSGSSLFAGQDVSKLSESKRRQMRWSEFSFVFQASMNVLNPVSRVSDQFSDVIRAHRPQVSDKEIRQMALDALRLVQIPSQFLDAYPHQLSGGMKQRVVIAMALVLRPKLVVMDEPTTALDVVVQRLILQRVAELKKELGFSILFITHDLSLLVSFADRIAIMYAGKIVEQARGRELYTDPLHPYTSALMQSFPPLHGTRERLHGIAGYPPSLRQLIPGCPFYERCSQRIEGVCDRIDPPLETISSKHEVACHLYDNRLEKEYTSAATQ